jgi:hypothetical protein
LGCAGNSTRNSRSGESQDPSGACSGTYASGRFDVFVTYHSSEPDPEVTGNSAPVVSLTRDAGAFWFFSANNIELAVKVVDGRAVNGRFWVLLGSLTNVAFDITISDSDTGAVWQRHNPAGILQSIADTSAF